MTRTKPHKHFVISSDTRTMAKPNYHDPITVHEAIPTILNGVANDSQPPFEIQITPFPYVICFLFDVGYTFGPCSLCMSVSGAGSIIVYLCE